MKHITLVHIFTNLMSKILLFKKSLWKVFQSCQNTENQTCYCSHSCFSTRCNNKPWPWRKTVSKMWRRFENRSNNNCESKIPCHSERSQFNAVDLITQSITSHYWNNCQWLGGTSLYIENVTWGTCREKTEKILQRNGIMLDDWLVLNTTQLYVHRFGVNIHVTEVVTCTCLCSKKKYSNSLVGRIFCLLFGSHEFFYRVAWICLVVVLLLNYSAEFWFWKMRRDFHNFQIVLMILMHLRELCPLMVAFQLIKEADCCSNVWLQKMTYLTSNSSNSDIVAFSAFFSWMSFHNSVELFKCSWYPLCYIFYLKILKNLPPSEKMYRIGK